MSRESHVAEDQSYPPSNSNATLEHHRSGFSSPHDFQQPHPHVSSHLGPVSRVQPPHDRLIVPSPEVESGSHSRLPFSSPVVGDTDGSPQVVAGHSSFASLPEMSSSVTPKVGSRHSTSLSSNRQTQMSTVVPHRNGEAPAHHLSREERHPEEEQTQNHSGEHTTSSWHSAPDSSDLPPSSIAQEPTRKIAWSLPSAIRDKVHGVYSYCH